MDFVNSHFLVHQNVRRRNHYSDVRKQAIYSMLLERTSMGKLKNGVTKAVSQETGVPLRVVQRIWCNGNNRGGANGVLSKMPKNCGRKRSCNGIFIINPKKRPLTRQQ